MTKKTVVHLGIGAFIIGVGLGAVGWIGGYVIIALALVASLIVIMAKSMGMPAEDTLGVVGFFFGIVLSCGFGWLVSVMLIIRTP